MFESIFTKAKPAPKKNNNRTLEKLEAMSVDDALSPAARVAIVELKSLFAAAPDKYQGPALVNALAELYELSMAGKIVEASAKDSESTHARLAQCAEKEKALIEMLKNGQLEQTELRERLAVNQKMLLAATKTLATTRQPAVARKPEIDLGQPASNVGILADDAPDGQLAEVRSKKDDDKYKQKAKQLDRIRRESGGFTGGLSRANLLKSGDDEPAAPDRKRRAGEPDDRAAKSARVDAAPAPAAAPEKTGAVVESALAKFSRCVPDNKTVREAKRTSAAAPPPAETAEAPASAAPSTDVTALVRKYGG